MARTPPDRCLGCGLVILSGAVMEAAARADEFGPILGLDRAAIPEQARAGYVGMGSLWLADLPAARHLYACPLCKADLLAELGQ